MYTVLGIVGYILLQICFCSTSLHKGEMGLVYKAYLKTREGSQIVAVKMTKSKVVQVNVCWVILYYIHNHEA